MHSGAALTLALELCPAIVRGEEYRAQLAHRVYDLFGADAGAGVTHWHVNDSRLEPPVQVDVAGVPPLTREFLEGASEIAARHPGIRRMVQVGTASAVRLSDVTRLRSLWGTELFRRMHGHVEDARFPISAALYVSRSSMIFIGLHRRHRDFSDDEVAELAQMQAPLEAAMHYRTAIDAAVARLQGQTYGPSGEQDGDDRSSPVTALCQTYRPTQRQAEVLTLAGQGLTNGAIGRRLGITERTVRKHLGAVYEQAGTRGRAAATAWWQRQLSG